ncbi:hypothetical protein HOLleu_26530 [Holothuria leucospilota]|uniref:Uncharacterized protein n=1 Tax=Holothuria leucospilota TaxID=206669 RepID=A0A9Q1H2W5_HOLLE|nr:hypothetical protein HOLleu_26530 [Holothuria leucospilota]
MQKWERMKCSWKGLKCRVGRGLTTDLGENLKHCTLLPQLYNLLKIFQGKF